MKFKKYLEESNTSKVEVELAQMLKDDKEAFKIVDNLHKELKKMGDSRNKTINKLFKNKSIQKSFMNLESDLFQILKR